MTPGSPIIWKYRKKGTSYRQSYYCTRGNYT